METAAAAKRVRVTPPPLPTHLLPPPPPLPVVIWQHVLQWVAPGDYCATASVSRACRTVARRSDSRPRHLTVSRDVAPATLPVALAWLQPRSLRLEALLVASAVPRLAVTLAALEELEMCFASHAVPTLAKHTAPVLTRVSR